MLRAFNRTVRKLFRRTSGQDLIEYAVLIALIAASVLLTVTGLGVKVPGFYQDTAAALPGPASESPEDPPGNPGNDKPAGGAGEDPSGKGK